MTVASVLGIGAHRVVVKVKRMGGGFGGKESRYVLKVQSYSTQLSVSFKIEQNCQI